MPKKIDDSKQIKIQYEEDYATLPHRAYSPNIEKWEFIDRMDKLQTEISGIKDLLESIHSNLQILTVNVHTLRSIVNRLLNDNQQNS